MPLGPPVASAVILVMTIVVSALIATEPEPFSQGPATMAAAALIVLSLIAASGMLLARGRWARWLVYGLGVCHVALVAATGAGWQWLVVALAALGIELVMAGPGASGWLRRLPSAEGPPPAATSLLLGLIGFPLVVAIANAEDLAVLAVAGSGVVVVAAAVYSRSGVPALWAMRAMVPIGAVLAAAATPWPRSLIVAGAGVALVAVSWGATVRQAAVPLVSLPSAGYRIPPQLAPREILDAAGLDSEGRPR